MAIKIGTISISLSAETSSFTTEMGKASKLAMDSSKNIERSFTIMGTAIVAATGAAVAGLSALVTRTQEVVFSMQKMAQQSGTSMEQFSKMAYAAKLAGMPIDQMSVIMTRISHSAFEAANGSKQAANAYKALGVNVQDAGGHFKTSDQLALELAKSLSKYKDSAAKTGIETMIMGRSGAQAASFLELLATRFDETSATAQKLGVVFDGPTAQGAVRLHETLIQLEEAGLGLSVRLLSSVSPALGDIANKISDFMSKAENMQRVEAFGRSMAEGIHVAGEAVGFMVEHLTAMKVIVASLVLLRVGGMFGPMIASASTASGVMTKLGIAVAGMTGNLLGIRKASGMLAPLIGEAIGYSGALLSLARSEGIAATFSYEFAGAIAFAKTQLAVLALPLAALGAGFTIFGRAISDSKSQAEQLAGVPVTWTDVWSGAIHNLKEDFVDLGTIIQKVLNHDFASLSDMKWTSLSQAAADAAKARQQAQHAGTTATPAASTGGGKKDLGGFDKEAKVDQLAKKLAELKDKAAAAQRALALVGASPEEKQSSEIIERYNLFLDEQKGLLDKLTPSKRANTEAEALSSITTIINTEALTKYNEELDSITKSTANATEEHLAMAEAVGKSAKAYQDAAVAAQVNKEFQKNGTDWQDNPKLAADAAKRSADIKKEMNAGNSLDDAKSLNSQKQQLAAQELLNSAILQGSDAKRQAAVVSEQAALRTSFVGRGDIDENAKQQQIDMIQKKSDAEAEAADLERAAGMSSVLRYQEQKKAIQDATDAAMKYGQAIDFREVMAANKEAWMQFQESQDKAILATGSAMDGLKVALNQMARDTVSNAQLMHDAFTQAIGSLNDALAKSMMVNGRNKGKQVEQAFSGAFGSIGSSLAKTGLQKGESALLGKFGGGGAGKPDGSQSNKYWVQWDTANQSGLGAGNELNDLLGIGNKPSAGGGAASATSGLMGMLNDSNWASSLFGGKLFGSGSMFGGAAAGASGAGGGLMSSLMGMIPMFADGTDSMVPGMPAIVGEKGPELFVPPSSGAIVPNSKLKNGLGGGHNFNIDARGSNDPAQTVSLIHQYMKKAAPQIASGTMKAMDERRFRTPPSARQA